MTLPWAEILHSSLQASALTALLDQADTCLRHWTVEVSDFLPAQVWHEGLERFGPLSDLHICTEGGVRGAERRRVLFCRAEQALVDGQHPEVCAGLAVHANFLFDRPHSAELVDVLHDMGCQPGELGDCWLCGDRGAQLVCTPMAAERLHGREGRLREVELKLESIALNWLHPPPRRSARCFSSIEASCRLDALASAGFGISRARAAALVRAGGIRLNWTQVRQPSQPVSAGDRLQLEDRGEVLVEDVSRTKRDRWRVEMQRS